MGTDLSGLDEGQQARARSLETAIALLSSEDFPDAEKLIDLAEYIRVGKEPPRMTFYPQSTQTYVVSSPDMPVTTTNGFVQGVLREGGRWE